MKELVHRRPSRWLLALVVASALMLSAVGTASANSSTQVILSGTGISTSGGPAGYWIWSQPGNNNYGNDGAGSIYFYALLKAEHPVEVSNVVVSGNSVSETVTSKDGLITCPTFTGTETSPGHGTVSFTCTVTTANGPVTVVADSVPSQVNISH